MVTLPQSLLVGQKSTEGKVVQVRNKISRIQESSWALKEGRVQLVCLEYLVCERNSPKAGKNRVSPSSLQVTEGKWFVEL